MQELLEQGIRISRSGKTTCPQCSHTRKKKNDPCLSVTIQNDGAVWNCHNCGWAGGTGGNKARKMQYKKPEFKAKVLTPTAESYLKERGISVATAGKLNVKSAFKYIPKEGKEVEVLQFPFYKNGEVVNIKSRSYSKGFTQEAECEKVLYNLDAIKDAEKVIWVEGEFDVLSLLECGYDAVISVPDGAPNQALNEGSSKLEFIQNCADWLLPVTQHILAFDNDANGKILTEEIAKRMGKERCWLVDWEEYKDANEALVVAGKLYVQSRISCVTPYPLSGVELISGDDVDLALDYLDRCEDGIYSTGFKSLDEYFRVRQGELTVVTGIPNHGKSEFLDCMTMNLAKIHGHKFAVCSLENPAIEHKVKLAEKYAGIARWSHKAPEFRKSLKGTLDMVGDKFMLLHTDDEAVTIDWIIEKTRELVVRYGIFGLVIDPHNQVEHKRPANMTEHEYIGDILRKLRSFAKSYGVHIFYVAHPRKIAAGETPTLYDISGSANWANMADNGIVVQRVYDDEGKRTTETDICIQKVRFQPIVGKSGIVRLNYKPEKCNYEEVNGGY